ncbi:MAG: TetR/AcrR family transcriptional regulator [Enhydrobacter sp.]|nr:MAG: TetR/AcrR family transcriptional regulator [Enhydrobacter sp.]
MSAGKDPVDAFLALVASKGFAEVTLRDVARESGLGLAELYGNHPNKVSLLAAFMARIDAQVLAGTPSAVDPEETARDRLFDTMMRRYDALKSHRAVLGSLWRAAARDPLFAAALLPVLRKSMSAMIEAAGIPSDGAMGALRQKGLLVIHLAVGRTFENDDSVDLSKTMAALDRRLKDAERWVQLIEKYAIYRSVA